MRKLTSTIAQAEAAANTVELYEGKKQREFSGIQYTLEQDDAVLITGRFPQKRVSEIVLSKEGKDYLGGIYRNAGSELQRIITFWFDK
jgi:hypothetical protein